jgi:peptidoglycan/LPS O-acetylase OafA/YrhL
VFTSNATLVNIAPSFLNAPAIAFLLFCCCRYATPLNGFLASKPLVFSGTVSYSVYVWCWVVVPMFRFTVPTVLGSSVFVLMSFKILGALVATSIVAYVSYRVIEEPSRRILRAAFESVTVRRERVTQS